MAAAVAGLSPVQQRKVAAIVGACVGDAAAQPLHWIYKHDVLESVTGGREDVEFHNPSANPFYRLPTGSNSCYGDQAYVMLKSLVDNKGLDLKHLTKSTYDFFGPESAYENQEIGKYTVGKEDKINVKKTLPIEGPWRNGCVKDFIKNVDSNTTPTGSEKDDQIDCVIRIIPLVAMYAGAANMLEKVEAGSQVLQDLDLCVATSLAAARVLEQFILHGDPEDFLDTVIAQIKDPANPDPKELDKAVIDMPKSFQSTLHATVSSTGYVAGIRNTIKVGGCNTSRSGFAGACMAAKEGFESIPESWRSRTLRYEEVLDLACKLALLEV